MKKRIRSFKYALDGLKVASEQPNMVIHIVIAILVICGGLILGLSQTEWILVILAIGLVLSAEAFNTSIEKLTDLVSPEHNRLAGIIKDLTAGAVLITAMTALVTGLIIFLPKFHKLF